MAGRVAKKAATAAVTLPKPRAPKPQPAAVAVAPVAVTSVTTLTAAPAHRNARREYRHRASDCGRLLFVGYLPPGTHIEIRCPACGRVHVIRVESDIVDIAQ